jgi:hypothetical protein
MPPLLCYKLSISEWGFPVKVGLNFAHFFCLNNERSKYAGSASQDQRGGYFYP